MTHFPRKSFRFAYAPPALLPVRTATARDVLWGKPLFHAPALPPGARLDPLPFTAQRVTQRTARD